MKRLITLTFCMLMTVFAMAQGAKYKSVGADEFAKIIADKNVQLVDVRTADEFKDGHIENALNIDVKSADFDKKSAALKKDKTVALYCRSGARSKVAAEKLAKNGYTVIELDGGILSWKGKKVK